MGDDAGEEFGLDAVFDLECFAGAGAETTRVGLQADVHYPFHLWLRHGIERLAARRPYTAG